GSPGTTETEALRSALRKLEQGLGPEALGELKTAASEGGPTGPLPKMRSAVEGRERIEIDHYSAARDELVTRRIDPEHVFFSIGNWYAVAWDHLSDEERMFRVDRIREVRPTGETFEPRGLLGLGRPLYSASPEDVEVRLLLHPPARWVAEYYETAEQHDRGGDLEVVLPTKDLAWVAKLVLRLGGEAVVLAPRSLNDAVLEVAGRALARYAR
ncbi:MAG TPA: WYL domain-containing protein, partial [Actinomycetota bacterium]|nr:WYL domain-containing protein [Actinomycetota bacterium]